MSATLEYFILDVFTNQPYAGNPLGVFLNYGNLTEQEMQKIARELNFSETTFINSLHKEAGGYPVRIFTPTREIPFAGHPVIGAAHILHRYIEQAGADTILLNLPIGQIPVSVAENTYWMTHQQPIFGKELSKELLSRVLRLSSNAFASDLPVVEVSTGLPFTLVPLRSIEAVGRANLDPVEYKSFADSVTAKGIMVFCEKGYDPHQHLAARVFVPHLGVPEDPATGSAAGCLAAYLLKFHPHYDSTLSLTLGQGYDIGRPSEIKIHAKFDGHLYHIQVGGRVKEIAHGKWNILL